MIYIPDPVDFFEAHDMEQAKRLKKLPMCCYCDNPVQDDFFFEIEGEIYCTDCMNHQFRKMVEYYDE